MTCSAWREHGKCRARCVAAKAPVAVVSSVKAWARACRTFVHVNSASCAWLLCLLRACSTRLSRMGASFMSAHVCGWEKRPPVAGELAIISWHDLRCFTAHKSQLPFDRAHRPALCNMHMAVGHLPAGQHTLPQADTSVRTPRKWCKQSGRAVLCTLSRRCCRRRSSQRPEVAVAKLCAEVVTDERNHLLAYAYL